MMLAGWMASRAKAQLPSVPGAALNPTDQAVAAAFLGGPVGRTVFPNGTWSSSGPTTADNAWLSVPAADRQSILAQAMTGMSADPSLSLFVALLRTNRVSGTYGQSGAVS